MRIVLTLTLLLGAVPTGTQERLADQLRKGVTQEEATQNVEQAIRTYQAVVAQFDEDRKAAATALYRLAELYRKTGRREQAVAAYQRVVREFGDQAALVEPSGRHLRDTFGLPESRGLRESAEMVRLQRELRETQNRLQLEVTRAREESRQARPSISARSRRAGPGSTSAIELEIQQLEQQLVEARSKVEAGVLPPAVMKELEVQLARTMEKRAQALAERTALERDLKEEQFLNQRTLESVQKEMQLVETRIRSIQDKVTVGASSPDDPELLQLKREMLGLERKAEELRLLLKR